MNFYYEPAERGWVAAYVNYICPVKGPGGDGRSTPNWQPVQLDLPRGDPEDNAYVLRALTPEEQTVFADSFGRVIQG